MVGPIVCATRGGEAGRRTQERAIALAKERGLELIFLCVFDPNSAGPLDNALAAAVEAEQEWLGRVLTGVARARAREQGLDATAEIRSGPVLESIEEYLCQVDASTLVIGEPKVDSPLSAFRADSIFQCARQVERDTGVQVVLVTAEA
jgi:nucleotide-binding universal stress UspA family protein